MLLNEFLKEHRKNEEQEATIAQLKQDFNRLADQQKQIEALTAGLQKVSASLKRANLRRKWSTITKAAAFHNQPSRFTGWRLFVFHITLSLPCGEQKTAESARGEVLADRTVNFRSAVRVTRAG